MRMGGKVVWYWTPSVFTFWNIFLDCNWYWEKATVCKFHQWSSSHHMIGVGRGALVASPGTSGRHSGCQCSWKMKSSLLFPSTTVTLFLNVKPTLYSGVVLANLMHGKFLPWWAMKITLLKIMRLWIITHFSVRMSNPPGLPGTEWFPGIWDFQL